MKLTNAIAYAPTGGVLWRIGAEEERGPFAPREKYVEASRDLVDPVRDPQKAGYM